MGVLALFGMNTVTWNESQLYGFWGLVAGVLIGVVMSFFMTAFLGTASVVGCWIYSKFDPIRISYFPEASDAKTPGDAAQAAESSAA